MALHHLTNGTMVDLTSDWVKPGHQVRRAFQRTPELAALLPQVDKAHFGLLEAQRQPLIRTVAELMAARTVADDRHDGYARSTYYSIEAHIQQARAAGDIATAQALIRLRDALFPHNLRVVNFSYREESGQAELLSSRLTPAMRQELQALPMKQGTVLDLVDSWIAAGTELGRLEKAIGSTQLPEQRIPVHATRNGWTRTINAVRTVADLVEDLDPVIVDALGQIDLAETAAERRIEARASRQGDAETETPADGPLVEEQPAVEEEPAAETAATVPEQPADQPAEQSAEQPADQSAEQPADQPVAAE